MFDKDKQIGRRIDEEFSVRRPSEHPEGSAPGEAFILHGVTLRKGDEAETELGKRQIVRLDIERIADGKCVERFEANTLAQAIAEKAAQAEADDFPALVELRFVWSRTWQKWVLAMQYLGDVPGDLLGSSLPL